MSKRRSQTNGNCRFDDHFTDPFPPYEICNNAGVSIPFIISLANYVTDISTIQYYLNSKFSYQVSCKSYRNLISVRVSYRYDSYRVSGKGPLKITISVFFLPVFSSVWTVRGFYWWEVGTVPYSHGLVDDPPYLHLHLRDYSNSSLQLHWEL